MNAEPHVERILNDEGLVGDLEGPAAEALVAWLVREAKAAAESATTDAAARTAIEALCRRGREFAQKAAQEPDPHAALTALLTQAG